MTDPTPAELELAREVAGAVHRRLGWTELDELVSDAYEGLLAVLPECPALSLDRRRGWLYAATRNKVVSSIREREGARLRKRAARAAARDIDGPAGDSGLLLRELIPDRTQDTPAAAEARIELARIGGLPARERRTLGRPDDEVAAELGVSADRVGALRAKARERLGRRTERPDPDGPPSPRTLKVLEAAARGLTAAETAAELELGFETVKTYRVKALDHYSARGIANAVHIAHQRGHLS